MPYTKPKTRILLSFAMVDRVSFAYWLRAKLMERFAFFHPFNVYMDCCAAREAHSIRHIISSNADEAGAASRAVNPDPDVSVIDLNGMRTPQTSPSLTNARLAIDACTGATKEEKAANPGVTFVTPDTRAHMLALGFVTIGATNSEWNDMYKKAMSEADIMIFVLNKAYLASPYCCLEWMQFQMERDRRPSFKGVALTFSDDAGASDRLFTAKPFPSMSAEDKEILGPEGGKVMKKTNIDFPEPFAKQGGGPGRGLLWHPNDWGLADADLPGLYALVQTELERSPDDVIKHQLNAL